MRNTYVLGCGPAGLAAAHAAVMAGRKVKIYSKNRKSQMFGAQYLHKPIPGIDCGDPVTVRYQLQGSITEYRQKVYGDSYDGAVSPGELEETHQAWDIRRAYDQLWDLYSPLIVDKSITSKWLKKQADPDIPLGREIISSVPLPSICSKPAGEHQFKAIRIWAAGEAPEIGKRFPRRAEDGKLIISGIEMEDDTVLCNGRKDPFWYRASLIFGRATVEWPWDPGFFLPEEDGSVVRKPIDNNCDCWPGVLRVGRYGTWTKGVLVHQAFEDTEKWITDQS